MRHNKMPTTIVFAFIIIVLICCGPLIKADENMEANSGSDSQTTTRNANCNAFLACESEMALLHQRCTQKSRNATIQMCKLESEFRSLAHLMEDRMSEFRRCVLSTDHADDANFGESNENSQDKVNCKSDEFTSISKPLIQPINACWRGVSQLRQRCIRLARCCPAGKICMKKLREGAPTRAVREKHVEINHKTLDCRSRVRENLAQLRNDTDNRLAARVRMIELAQNESSAASESNKNDEAPLNDKKLYAAPRAKLFRADAIPELQLSENAQTLYATTTLNPSSSRESLVPFSSSLTGSIESPVVVTELSGAAEADTLSDEDVDAVVPMHIRALKRFRSGGENLANRTDLNGDLAPKHDSSNIQSITVNDTAKKLNDTNNTPTDSSLTEPSNSTTELDLTSTIATITEKQDNYSSVTVLKTSVPAIEIRTTVSPSITIYSTVASTKSYASKKVLKSFGRFGTKRLPTTRTPSVEYVYRAALQRRNQQKLRSQLQQQQQSRNAQHAVLQSRADVINLPSAGWQTFSGNKKGSESAFIEMEKLLQEHANSNSNRSEQNAPNIQLLDIKEIEKLNKTDDSNSTNQSSSSLQDQASHSNLLTSRMSNGRRSIKTYMDQIFPEKEMLSVLKQLQEHNNVYVSRRQMLNVAGRRRKLGTPMRDLQKRTRQLALARGEKTRLHPLASDTAALKHENFKPAELTANIRKEATQHNGTLWTSRARVNTTQLLRSFKRFEATHNKDQQAAQLKIVTENEALLKNAEFPANSKAESNVPKADNNEEEIAQQDLFGVTNANQPPAATTSIVAFEHAKASTAAATRFEHLAELPNNFSIESIKSNVENTIFNSPTDSNQNKNSPLKSPQNFEKNQSIKNDEHVQSDKPIEKNLEVQEIISHKIQKIDELSDSTTHSPNRAGNAATNATIHDEQTNLEELLRDLEVEERLAASENQKNFDNKTEKNLKETENILTTTFGQSNRVNQEAVEKNHSSNESEDDGGESSAGSRSAAGFSDQNDTEKVGIFEAKRTDSDAVPALFRANSLHQAHPLPSNLNLSRLAAARPSLARVLKEREKLARKLRRFYASGRVNLFGHENVLPTKKRGEKMKKRMQAEIRRTQQRAYGSALLAARQKLLQRLVQNNVLHLNNFAYNNQKEWGNKLTPFNESVSSTLPTTKADQDTVDNVPSAKSINASDSELFDIFDSQKTANMNPLYAENVESYSINSLGLRRTIAPIREWAENRLAFMGHDLVRVVTPKQIIATTIAPLKTTAKIHTEYFEKNFFENQLETSTLPLIDSDLMEDQLMTTSLPLIDSDLLNSQAAIVVPVISNEIRRFPLAKRPTTRTYNKAETVLYKPNTIIETSEIVAVDGSAQREETETRRTPSLISDNASLTRVALNLEDDSEQRRTDDPFVVNGAKNSARLTLAPLQDEEESSDGAEFTKLPTTVRENSLKVDKIDEFLMKDTVQKLNDETVGDVETTFTTVAALSDDNSYITKEALQSVYSTTKAYDKNLFSHTVVPSNEPFTIDSSQVAFKTDSLDLTTSPLQIDDPFSGTTPNYTLTDALNIPNIQMKHSSMIRIHPLNNTVDLNSNSEEVVTSSTKGLSAAQSNFPATPDAYESTPKESAYRSEAQLSNTQFEAVLVNESEKTAAPTTIKPPPLDSPSMSALSAILARKQLQRIIAPTLSVRQPHNNNNNMPRLVGYRNKVLYARRQLTNHHLTTTASPTSATPHTIEKNEIINTNTVNERLQITVMDSSEAESGFKKFRAEESEVRRSPQNRIFNGAAFTSTLSPPPQFVVAQPQSDENTILEELLAAKRTLVLNLEKFLRAKKEQIRMRTENVDENERLTALRRTKKDYDERGQLSGYCELFSTCADQLKFVQKKCGVTTGRLIPGLPKRRFGACNAKLLTLYQRVDTVRAELEESVENCLVEKIATRDAKVSSSCAMQWPLLPDFEAQATCVERVAVVQNHCKKLARCCTSLDSCRRSVESFALARRLHLEEERLSLRAAECQVNAHEEYHQLREQIKQQQNPPPSQQQHNDGQLFSSADQSQPEDSLWLSEFTVTALPVTELVPTTHSMLDTRHLERRISELSDNEPFRETTEASGAQKKRTKILKAPTTNVQSDPITLLEADAKDSILKHLDSINSNPVAALPMNTGNEKSAKNEGQEPTISLTEDGVERKGAAVFDPREAQPQLNHSQIRTDHAQSSSASEQLAIAQQQNEFQRREPIAEREQQPQRQQLRHRRQYQQQHKQEQKRRVVWRNAKRLL